MPGCKRRAAARRRAPAAGERTWHERCARLVPDAAGAPCLTQYSPSMTAPSVARLIFVPDMAAGRSERQDRLRRSTSGRSSNVWFGLARQVTYDATPWLSIGTITGIHGR